MSHMRSVSSAGAGQGQGQGDQEVSRFREVDGCALPNGETRLERMRGFADSLRSGEFRSGFVVFFPFFFFFLGFAKIFDA